MTPPTHSMQKILTQKFRKPAHRIPPPPSQQQQHYSQQLAKRRRPLQPGELHRHYHGNAAAPPIHHAAAPHPDARSSLSGANNLTSSPYHPQTPATKQLDPQRLHGSRQHPPGEFCPTSSSRNSRWLTQPPSRAPPPTTFPQQQQQEITRPLELSTANQPNPPLAPQRQTTANPNAFVSNKDFDPNTFFGEDEEEEEEELESYVEPPFSVPTTGFHVQNKQAPATTIPPPTLSTSQLLDLFGASEQQHPHEKVPPCRAEGKGIMEDFTLPSDDESSVESSQGKF